MINKLMFVAVFHVVKWFLLSHVACKAPVIRSWLGLGGSLGSSAVKCNNNIRRSEHITDALFSLHWLRVPERIVFKVAMLTFRALHGTAPPYLTSQFTRVADMPNRRRLRSSSSNQHDVPSFRLSTVGSRAFPIAGAKIWNSLPDDFTAAPSCPPSGAIWRLTYSTALITLTNSAYYTLTIVVLVVALLLRPL